VAVARQESTFTYSIISGSETYTFVIVVDAQGLVSVQNVRGPRGATSTIPDAVLEAIDEAKALVEQMVVETQADSGTLVFTGQTSQSATIAAGVLNNTNYRVVYTTPDGTVLTTESQTTTGFDAVAATAYGSPTVPLTVTYVVLVSAQQASTTGATLTFTDADGFSKAVAFSTAMETADYRVVLSEGGFFKAMVTNQTALGFTVELPFSVPTGQTVTVGYDVFVG
jgi:hypothetical protein